MSPLLTPISFVYFDLDDTLLDHRGAEKLALRRMYETIPELQRFDNLEQLQSIYHQINTKVWIQYADAVINKDSARVLRFTNLLLDVGVSDDNLSDNLGHLYLKLYANYWKWMDGAQEMFVRVASHLKVGILTNGFAEVQRQKISQFSELSRLASCIVISEETGFMKPDPRIFDYATRESGFNANEILFVGDSLRSDVRGGKNAGWTVAWLVDEIKPNERNIADVTFSSWQEFEGEILPILVSS